VTEGIPIIILALLGITLFVLGGVGGFMVYLAEKSAAVSHAEAENDRLLEEEEAALAVSNVRSRAAGHATLSHHSSHSRRGHGRGRHRSVSPRRRLNFPD